MSSVGAMGMLVAFVVAGCGANGAAENNAPKIVVTTSILGDIVSTVVGDLADVEVIMPLGSDPHDFAPSARQAESMENADLVVVNGAGFEEGMLGLIEGLEESGADVFTFADHVDLLGDDPHLWTDPTRVMTGVAALGTELAAVDGLGDDALGRRVDDYLADLETLDTEMKATLASVVDGQRVLVTDHEVFGYFADRFDFSVVGAVIPSTSTNAEASAAAIEALADVITTRGIPAIFSETTQSNLSAALAESIGNDVAVVELFTESLGDAGSGAETYVAMMSTNARLISEALAPS